MAPYNTIKVPLDAVLDRKKISPDGVDLPDIAVLRLSAAAENDVFLHFGESGDATDISQGYVFRVSPPEKTGLYVTVKVAHPGESLKILLGYSSGAVAARSSD